MNLDKEQSAPPGNASKTRNPGWNFDINMLIILAAFICALVFALRLNTIVPCTMSCSRRLTFEAPMHLAARGLKRSVLYHISVAVYGSGTNNASTDCAICLGEFADGEIVPPKMPPRFPA
ncbi:RING-H2 finger protein ATL74-like [Actinidia eriantha]|uniref:RING-H2 finger protein ATL74-like n=1 Tax=Actinidia eriantha TaxID=165200 RepID=UPI00258BF6EA|nr:RING-H2 finger protein ATL74-like [Actinidia eriantha]